MNRVAQFAAYGPSIRDKYSDTQLILVAPFVSERGCDLVKEMDIGFVDLEGNAYVKFGGVLVERYGPRNKKKEKRIQKKLFSRKSTWIIRKMLVDRDRSWKTQELASAATVSLGMVYKVTERLEAEGYIEKSRGAISLLKPGELLDAWCEAYRFREEETVGYYSPDETREQVFKRLAKLPSDPYALTLGAGASLIAPFVRSTDTHPYVNMTPGGAEDALSLGPVEFGGNVHIVTPSDHGVFLDTQRVRDLTVVSNIQLYLDLYDYPQRGREQAEFLREEEMDI